MLDAGALVLGLALAGSGCGRPESIELAAIRGCGLDQEFSGLRVRVLGDFPASGGSEILLGPTQRGTIPELPDGATGVAAEGLFGTTTTAIGRSWGVDPELARGRLRGFDEDAAVLPVFFAAPDSLCELEFQPEPGAELIAAAHPAGDVLLVGGLSPGLALREQVVHVDLLTGRTRALGASLAQPRRGHSVYPIDGRRFVIVGGAWPGALAQDRVLVDVDGAGSVTSVGPLELEGDALLVSDHAAARSPSPAGQLLIAGGCDIVDPQARCDPASALTATYWIDPAQPGATVPLPPLTQARYGAHAVVSTDGVAWVAGGFGSDGTRLRSLERLRPGGTWAPVHELADAGVHGLAVLDGGLVVLSDDAGLIHWWSEAGSGSLDPTSRAPPLAIVATERPMLALPGERVLVDTWLFTPGTAAVDPASGRVELPPLARHGGQLLGLHDGTALIVGGWMTDSQALADAPLLRLRPRLDGPDEWTPELAGPQNDAFVGNTPGRATVIVGGLRLDALGGEPDALPPVRAHVRGFRSRAMRLEFSYEAEPGSTAHVIVGQGSESLVAIALGSEIVVRRRGPDGSTETLDCGPAPADGALAGELVLELGAGGNQLRLDAAGTTLATCELEWPSSAGLSVGFGVTGAEGARFFGLRLARR
ncbi:hypothetical protein [Enhygromyxa salina]|uniref:hypothetical protein n=1 Tax=Enhygromyxa salina TaxID=215803 RepID=UPI0011B27EAF|nr:hypothetical protein [Enhygromyxa salina]